MRIPPLASPNELCEKMTYAQWCETYGKYRWYHENSLERLYYPLDYEWKRIYESCTKYADMYFNDRIIYEPSIFTANFLVNVPINWMKFKTELEMFSGTLDGTTIDPNMFNQGFTRDTTENENNDDTDNVKSSQTGNIDENLGARTDRTFTDGTQDADSKSRAIDYNQGVQAYDNNINNNNIGELGNNYASNMTDSVTKTHGANTQEVETQTGKQENTTDSANEYTGNAKSNRNRSRTEHIHETRINYYDNLAFLRERQDRLNVFKDFYSYFEPYFAHAEGFTGAWV